MLEKEGQVWQQWHTGWLARIYQYRPLAWLSCRLLQSRRGSYIMSSAKSLHCWPRTKVRVLDAGRIDKIHVGEFVAKDLLLKVCFIVKIILSPEPQNLQSVLFSLWSQLGKGGERMMEKRHPSIAQHKKVNSQLQHLTRKDWIRPLPSFRASGPAD